MKTGASYLTDPDGPERSGRFCKHDFVSVNFFFFFFLNFSQKTNQRHEQSGREQTYQLRASDRQTRRVNTKNSPHPPPLSPEVEPASQFGERIENRADESGAFVPARSGVQRDLEPSPAGYFRGGVSKVIQGGRSWGQSARHPLHRRR